jgi:uncharacterized protein
MTAAASALHRFSVLAKPSGADCNLDCAYCFYLDKAGLYPGASMRMPDPVLKAYVRQLLRSQYSQPSMEVSFAWQGGEPTLMGLDFFRRFVSLVTRYRKTGQPVNFSLQTNGILLDDAWCAFLKENNFLIGLSLDGPGQMHDAYRMDKGGRGTFERVRRAWDLLQAYHVDTNILCTIHAANQGDPRQLYRFFRDELGAEFIQFIPIVEPLPDRSGVSSRSVDPHAFGRFLNTVFDEWVGHDVGRVFIQTFDSALASWLGLPASICIFQETCGLNPVLEHNGDLYSCDHFVDPAHHLGNLLETPVAEMVASPAQRRFGLDKAVQLPQDCRDCDVLFACHGECPRNRSIGAPGGEPGMNYLCAGYRSFFHHVDAPMQRMAGLLRRGRPAAEVMLA